MHWSDVPCKLWAKAMKGGYGVKWYPPLKRPLLIHRIVFFEAHGWWPPEVGHWCNAAACYEEAHLYATTHAENQAYISKCGRGRGKITRGEDHKHSKLTEAQVLEIRTRYVPRAVTQQALADEFGVSQHVISSIIRRKGWAHI